MDTTLTFAPKTVAAIPYVAEREPPWDTKVPVVKGFDGAATLPANKPFVAQVVNARLSGTAFPEQPSAIAPSDRTLRPYDIPMLPSEDRATEQSEEKKSQSVSAERAEASKQTDRSDEPARLEKVGDRSSRQPDNDRTDKATAGRNPDA